MASVQRGTMPREEGSYLVAFDDGAVETYPMSIRDITLGEIRDGYSIGLYWADCMPSDIMNLAVNIYLPPI